MCHSFNYDLTWYSTVTKSEFTASSKTILLINAQWKEVARFKLYSSSFFLNREKRKQYRKEHFKKDVIS